MPELPEVETSCRGIATHLYQQTIVDVIIRHYQLRWPISQELPQKLAHQRIQAISRRAKYILIQTTTGTLLMHLGMSGSLRILPQDTPLLKHDHLDLILANGQCLRFNDPRRFGAILWVEKDPYQHPLLVNLGPEPLTEDFAGHYLYTKTRHKNVSIKTLIMDSRMVVGVGNIYANEALFMAGIHPKQIAHKLSQLHCDKLVSAIKQVLLSAIEQGGTTLRNFVSSEGKPGYFKQQLYVYGRGGEACKNCLTALVEIRLGQRATVFCPNCQSEGL
ncbi:MAG: formamidopyrimidine-DNA glycosylase [Gammaproteobacteria bacterium]|jgi:formamidopyrimidine-DNA glycosylase|nr:formamidopyrimidine-DNA glycosylase [Gammaproteobacteria bacterium]